MRLTFVLAALCLVAGCSPQEENQPPQPGTAEIAAGETVDTLAGTWRVSSLDGEAVVPRNLVVFHADDEQLWWEPRCAGFIRDYQVEGTLLAMQAASDTPPPAAGAPPPPVCAIGLPPGLSDAFAALNAADSVTALAGGVLRFTGEGRSLELVPYTPGQRIAPDDAAPPPGAEEPPPPPFTGALAGEYRLAGINDREHDLPHGVAVSIGEDHIEYSSQCVTARWSYSWRGGVLATQPEPIAACDRGRYPDELAIEAAFDAATRVERTPANGLRFSGGGHSLTLFSQ